MGNHDKNQALFNRYHAYPGARSYYAFSYSNTRFIVLDTSLDYTPASLQYAWLRQELASSTATTATWRVVVFHEPPFSEGWNPCGEFDGDAKIREVLVPLFETSGVDLVLNGHVHGYERGARNGVTYVTTGGGGGKLDHFCQHWSHIVVATYVNHYVRVEVGARTLAVSAYQLERVPIDAFTLMR